MAEEGKNEGQERTEQPTPKRLKDAKQKGQVPRSRELDTTVILVTGTLGLFTVGDGFAEGLRLLLEQGLVIERENIFDDSSIVRIFSSALLGAFNMLLPLLAILFVAVFVSPVVIGGFSFSPNALAPKFSKLNPIKGLKKVFSVRGLMELLKGILKVALIGAFAVLMLSLFSGDLLTLSNLGLERAVARSVEIVGLMMLVTSSVLILVAAIDVPFQLFQHHKQLKMTKQEVKDENKETEGNPELKGHQRRMQQEVAMQRMMEAVPEADVVVTNPTHFAVALKYDEANMAAPRVVAKGADLVAARIRETAMEHDVPLFEAPLLARSLFANTEIDDEIPAGLYLAVAQVLAYIFQLRMITRPGVKKPKPPSKFDIPEDLIPTNL
jgi:flagellar biosynthetic protein FlhB